MDVMSAGGCDASAGCTCAARGLLAAASCAGCAADGCLARPFPLACAFPWAFGAAGCAAGGSAADGCDADGCAACAAGVLSFDSALSFVLASHVLLLLSLVLSLLLSELLEHMLSLSLELHLWASSSPSFVLRFAPRA